MEKLLIVGCGYVGLRVADACRDAYQISALTRSKERVAEFRSKGIEPIVGDWLVADEVNDLPDFDRILVSVPHRAAHNSAELTHVRGLQNLSKNAPARCKWVYLSTTGVFGRVENEVVDEETEPSPTRIGGQIATRAEQWLRDSGLWHTTVRLAGIYGPGRVPLADRLRAGETLEVPQQGYLNLVHVEDIAQMIRRVFETQLKRSCYLFSDGHPVQRLTFYNFLAKLCGVDQPVFVRPSSEDSRSRRAGSKRVDPSRLIEELDFDFQFPSFETGLADALSS